MIPSRHAGDLVLGTWRLLGQPGGMPRQLVWDNEGGAGKFRRRRPPVLPAQFAEFRGLPGAGVVVLPPKEPEHKGIVERNKDYLETSFLPGRTFTSPADFSAQLAGWLVLASSRPKRVLGCASRQPHPPGRAHDPQLAACARDNGATWHDIAAAVATSPGQAGLRYSPGSQSQTAGGPATASQTRNHAT